MYGLDIDTQNIVFEPKQIDGDVYVPYYIESEMGEMFTFVRYEVLLEALDFDEDSDYRIDGDLR